jgi:hypothetical protein
LSNKGKFVDKEQELKNLWLEFGHQPDEKDAHPWEVDW